MHMKSKLVGMFCALSLINVGILLADDDNQGGQFQANLSGYQEIPTLSTASSGDVTVKLSADQKTLTVTLTFTKLEGVAQAAGLFFGAPATTGNIVAHICGAPKPACPATADGTVTTTIVAADVVCRNWTGDCGRGSGGADPRDRKRGGVRERAFKQVRIRRNPWTAWPRVRVVIRGQRPPLT
jgi:hypothetical protein